MIRLQRALNYLVGVVVHNDRRHMIAIMRGLLRGYDYVYEQEQVNYGLQEVEKTYHSALYHLDVKGQPTKSRTFTVAGKIDKLATDRRADALVLFDHKTTTMDISDHSNVYWRQLIIESQPSHYELLLWANGIKLDRIIWDVTRRPQYRYRKLTTKEASEIASLCTYQTFEVSNETRDWIIDSGEGNWRENDELLEKRVARESIERPELFFCRRLVVRTQDDLVEYSSELWDAATDIRTARTNNRWYRNPGACMSYGRPCAFLGICSGYDQPDSARWKKRLQVHEELELNGDGRSVLTNSRVQCFQSCRKKHYYRYELGIERVNQAKEEPLWFGTIWGCALDHWWQRPTSNPGECNVNRECVTST